MRGWRFGTYYGNQRWELCLVNILYFITFNTWTDKTVCAQMLQHPIRGSPLGAVPYRAPASLLR